MKVLCESCGADADVKLEDGSTWCDACGDAARSLGYDDELGVPLSGSEGVVMSVEVDQDDLRRLIADTTREPCSCDRCVLARRRLRAVAWPKVGDARPDVEESDHVI